MGNDSSRRPAAVVVGLCAHGLAIVRSLARRGVRVHALEARPFVPGVRTRLAQVHLVGDINGPALVDHLRELRPRLDGPGKPVLLLANDNMVRQVAERISELQGLYALSWAASAPTVLELLSKANLEARCAKVGADYPQSVLLRGPEELAAVQERIGLPCIVKPVRPLSPFKVRRVADARELEELVSRFESALPFLVQQWVPGDDRSLRFCALYLDRGEVRARFEGRKLRSFPPALGGATAADACPDDTVYRETLRFFSGLGLSGPVSLEVKLGPDGRPWVIEPTVGRTDYWLPVCTANGVDLPWIEYLHQAKEPVPASAATDEAIWLDTERDPLSVLTCAGAWTRALVRGKRVVLPYFGHGDGRPFRASLGTFVRGNTARAWGFFRRRLGRLFGATPAAPTAPRKA
jgi:predicted ATP-grasp superfamily ATP-dependent carboligase